MEMEVSDSENEGQLLIDESVDSSKRPKTRGRRGRKTKKTVSKKKNVPSLAVKTASAPSKDKKPKDAKNIENKPNNNVTRTSTRVRKRVRMPSPSPVRSKKEPPKKKLKVKIKNVAKSGKKAKKTAPKVPNEKKIEEKHHPDGENVDVENVSDQESTDIQYSSVIVDEDLTVKNKKLPKPRKKTGIKLKLSLGKVLASQIAESITGDSVRDDPKNGTSSSPPSETAQNKEHMVKPLIISKRRVSCEANANDSLSDSTISEDRVSIVAKEDDSPYYSSATEDHKPLTLRLSVGKPRIINRSLSEFGESGPNNNPIVFPNIRRSWSVAPVENAVIENDTTSLNDGDSKKEVNLSNSEESPKKTPYFTTGLQSLLDVVSVEINEQGSGHLVPPHATDAERMNQKPQSLPNSQHFNSNKSPKLLKSPSLERPSSNHEGHLPSLAFPKPLLNFSSKKRPRIKSVTNESPQRMSENTTAADVLKQADDDEIPDHPLTEKEKRRREKKKILNSDFVDPDSVIAGNEPEEKRPKKKPVASYIPKTKAGGFSLLMPQMAIKADVPEPEPKQLQMAGSCTVPNKHIIPKRPRKGMATTKQRLANKLKIRKTFAF